jgi:hypothetical protein
MPRFVTGGRSVTTTPSASIPLGSLYASASVKLRVVEIGVFNTTTNAVAVGLARLTTTGTRGSATTIGKLDDDNPIAAVGTGYLTHSAGPTLTMLPYRAILGAAAGAGFVWTFGGFGLVIAATANNGIGIMVPDGTGQHCDFYFVWDE